MFIFDIVCNVISDLPNKVHIPDDLKKLSLREHENTLRPACCDERSTARQKSENAIIK